jgi:hypothetical protein
MTNSTEAARSAIIAKIKKLRQMTEANGASESEAAKALEVLTRLLSTHAISESEIREESRLCAFLEYCDFNSSSSGEAIWLKSFYRVLDLFDCKGYQHFKSVNMEELDISTFAMVGFIFGQPADREAAYSMVQVIHHAMVAGAAPLRGRNVKISYMLGLADRVNEKLTTAIMAKRYAKPTGTGLVVLKNQLVNDEFAAALRAQGVSLDKAPSSTYKINESAYRKGQSAGAALNIGLGTRVPGASKAQSVSSTKAITHS